MLTDLLRAPLLGLAESESAKKLAVGNPATRSVVNRYVAGESILDVVDTVGKLAIDGLMATVDYLGEGVTSPADADHTRDTYLELLAAMKDAGYTDGGRAEVSVKLTALGISIEDKKEEAFERLMTICRAADDAGTTVTVDMEDHTVTDETLHFVKRAREEFPWVGAVLQSMLRRTHDDCVDMSTPGSRTRLCKGAYSEPEEVAYEGHAIDTSYVTCLSELMSRPGRPLVATHDPRLVAIAETLAAHQHLGYEDWEIQMLFGVRPAEQRRLAAAGRSVRVYVPFGNDWWGYMVRRMAERPANLALFLRSVVGK